LNVEQFEKQLSITFKDKTLLRQAFTHSSYVNEHRNKQLLNNERLEFLGDAVLELSVSKYLYLRNPKMAEGDMTRRRAAIVCEEALFYFAQQLGFGQYVLLGKGEERTGGRERQALLADVFEAFLGALYLDQGIDFVVDFLEKHVYIHLTDGAFSHKNINESSRKEDEVSKSHYWTGRLSGIDFKSELQEIVQRDRHATLIYDIVEERGPSHNREFVAEVIVNGKLSAKGVGRTKKEAEQRAAEGLLKKMKNKT